VHLCELNNRLHHTQRKNPFCLPLWVLGLSGMVTGAVLDFGSLSFAAQSLLAPLAVRSLHPPQAVAVLFHRTPLQQALKTHSCKRFAAEARNARRHLHW
jgi:hypothetical protein